MNNYLELFTISLIASSLLLTRLLWFISLRKNQYFKNDYLKEQLLKNLGYQEEPNYQRQMDNQKRFQANPLSLPKEFRDMGFKKLPSQSELKAKYRELAKIYHPDSTNGSQEKFIKLRENYEKCNKYLEENK